MRNSMVRATLFISICFTLFFACEPAGLDEYNKGAQYQHAGNHTLAEQQYKMALQNNHDLGEAYLNLGVIYIAKGWYDGAEEHTKRAIEIFETTQKTYIIGSTVEQTLALAYNNMGIIEINRGLKSEIALDIDKAKKHWEKAMYYFNTALKLDPSNPDVNVNIETYKHAY